MDPYAEGVGRTGLLSYWASIFRKYHLEEVWSTCVTGGKIRSVHEFATVERALEAADAPVDPRRAR